MGFKLNPCALFILLTILFSASLSNSLAEKRICNSIHHKDIPNLILHENHHGLRELTPEDWEKIRAIPEFKLPEEMLNRPLPSKVDSVYWNINRYKDKSVLTGVYFCKLASGKVADLSKIILAK